MSHQLTYPEVGGTAGELPAGYRHIRGSRELPSGVGFDDAVTALMTWRLHQRAGLRVAASSPTAMLGAVVLLRLGIGPVAIDAPCRVVRVVDETDRKGFAYGTLAGHPESGEESFVLTRLQDGTVRFDVVAFSRPHSRIARLGGPLTTAAQRLATRRYLHALDEI